VINASAARKFGFASPHEAVGKMVFGTDDNDRQMQVVGVAPDIRHRSARQGEQPSVFYLRDQVRILTIRCSGDPVAVQHAVQDLWPRHFPNEPVDVLHMERFIVDEFYADDLRLAKLLGASSVIATAIAAFGIYVLAAYSVQRREREIVLRKLYGANGVAVGGLVLREFALLVGAGALVGLPLAWIALQRYLAGFAERAPVGAWTIAAALLLALLVTLGSTLRHTLAAVRIRPALALRE
jgi:putative ABC transport system permease protein